MKKLLYLIVLSLFMMTGLAWAQGHETFDNLGISGTSYQTGDFEGQDGSTWEYSDCRGDITITGKAITLRNNTTSYFESGTIEGGIGQLRFKYKQAFSNNVNMNVLVNDVVKVNVKSSSEQNVVKESGIIDVEFEGVFQLKFINDDNPKGNQVCVDDIEWTAYGEVFGGSEIDITSDLGGFYYVVGHGPSDSQLIKISSSSLTHDVLVSAPDNYEISLDDNIFESSVTLTKNADGTLTEQDVHIRLKSNLDVNSYTGNITVSSDGAATQTVALSGNVIKTNPTNHVTDFQASVGAPPCSTIKVTWTNPEGEYAPDYYLILASKVSYEDIVEPTDGTSMTNSKYRVNASGTSVQAVFNQLDPLTNYYFKIYPYNNDGTYVRYYTGGIIPSAEAKTSKEPETFIFWDFNDPPSSGPWSSPINSTTGDGALEHDLVSTLSYAGTTENGLDGTVNGGSFTIQGGTDLVNNGKHFTLEVPTTGYANIGLSYAAQRSGTGFNINKIYYSTDGNEPYTYLGMFDDITTGFVAYGFDFSAISEANDNPNFKVRIEIDEATNAGGNIRFDNIRITGTEVCAYPTDVPITIDDFGIITFTGGNANISTATMPDMPNPNITAGDYESLALGLIGNGPWAIEIISTFDHCAYNWQGGWHDATLGANGFEIGIASIAKGSNNLFIVLSDQNPTLPVELSLFMVELNSSGTPVVTWETQTETGVNGFYIYRGVNKNINEAILVSSLIQATNSSITGGVLKRLFPADCANYIMRYCNLAI